jgi:uncharacterized protein YbjT (DUF2867 family)
MELGYYLYLCIFSLLASASVEGLSLQTNVNRRDWIKKNAASVVSGGVLAGLVLHPLSAPAVATAAAAGDAAPIAVLGANGRTGALCVTACLFRGIPVRALTRSGVWDFPPAESSGGVTVDDPSSNLLSVAACDVKDPEALRNAIKGCRGVIYAASASKKGGNAKAIDNLGVVQGGDACLNEKIPRYVVISSLATTRPNSLGYKFTNVFGGIMEEKRLGEVGVQTSYKSASAGTSYTILRPGGLEEPKKNIVLGPATLEISQGDVIAGIVSRADLAQVAVELALSNAPNLKNTAIELYYTSSAQPCEGQFKSMMTDGTRLHGNTYAELLQGIQPGIDYYVPA